MTTLINQTPKAATKTKNKQQPQNNKTIKKTNQKSKNNYTKRQTEITTQQIKKDNKQQPQKT